MGKSTINGHFPMVPPSPMATPSPVRGRLPVPAPLAPWCPSAAPRCRPPCATTRGSPARLRRRRPARPPAAEVGGGNRWEQVGTGWNKDFVVGKCWKFLLLVAGRYGPGLNTTFLWKFIVYGIRLRLRYLAVI